MVWFLPLLLVATILAITWAASRRARRLHTPAPERVEIVLEPADPQQVLPPAEPPPAASPPVELLTSSEIFKKLRQLALGVSELRPPFPEHAAITTAAAAAIDDAGTQGQYAPRRPNLLPQLMRAVDDENASRRELATIIARDPSMVSSLLKVANSSFYRVTPQPIESIDRAVAVLGSKGIRSLIATALMQPIFQISNGGEFLRFQEIVWDHALRSANAAVAHAVLVEKADPFAAELLSLVAGLAEVVLFRATLDQYAIRTNDSRLRPDPGAIAALLDSDFAKVARQIGVSWELSERILAALEEQASAAEPTTPLGRSLRFGRLAGALALLQINHTVDDATVRASLPDAGLPPEQLERMWTRLTHESATPTPPGKKATRPLAPSPRARD